MIFKEEIELLRYECEVGIDLLSQSTACFTGYRPQKCPWGFNEQDQRCIRAKERTREKIESAINRGYNTFITGMALGFDTIGAELVLEFKQIYPNIKLIGALPCKDQDKLWKEEDKKRYKNILNQLDGVRCIYDKYTGPECMLERNHYMISNSSLVIALFDGKPGGTKKTLEEAEKLGLEIEIIEP